MFWSAEHSIRACYFVDAPKCMRAADQKWVDSNKWPVIEFTQPPPRDGAWSALFSNLSKSALDNYEVKRSKRPLLEEVAWSRLLFPISKTNEPEENDSVWSNAYLLILTIISKYQLKISFQKQRNIFQWKDPKIDKHLANLITKTWKTIFWGLF